MTELEMLSRAHALFAGVPTPKAVEALTAAERRAQGYAPLGAGTGPSEYRRTSRGALSVLLAAGETDTRFARVLAAALADHAEGRRRTGAILAEASADSGTWGDSPAAQREAVLRRVARLRAQHAHIMVARTEARRRLLLLRALRYLLVRRRTRLRNLRPQGAGRPAAAVRAALSRLGRPYVWGATGPDRFDCSGLVQWAYRQVGVVLPRTTYDQIGVGIPVPRSAVMPGDLVFPNAGHVQMAIGGNLVVEAPYSGASVRISPLGAEVQIRRPA